MPGSFLVVVQRKPFSKIEEIGGGGRKGARARANKYILGFSRKRQREERKMKKNEYLNMITRSLINIPCTCMRVYKSSMTLES